MKEKARIKNLTPHEVTLIMPDGTRHSWPPSGIVARCKTRKEARTGYPVPAVRERFGEVEGLPDPEPGVFYIVSRLVMQACPHRHDLLSPTDLVRDEEGNIIGCRSFAVN